jgi:Fe-S cluster assembly protein SufD
VLKDKLIQAYQEQEDLCFKASRHKHMEQFSAHGFPTIKDEDWKYTNLLPLIKQDFQLKPEAATLSLSDIQEYILTDTDTYLLVFINGRLSEEHSTLVSDSFTISSMLKEKGSDLIEQYWGQCLPEEVDNMVALNTALAVEGAFIHVPKSVVVDKPIQVIYASVNGETPQFAQSRSLIVVEENAQVQITERHQNFNGAATFTNGLTEIYVAKNAIVDFYKIQNDKRHCSLVDNTWVKQSGQSNCTVDTFSFGSQFIRNNLSFLMTEEYVESNMNGITLIGQDQLVDHHTFADHAVPNCNSNELYKGIFDDNAKGVFNGKVMVRPDAQKTNAFQANNNLLLTDKASIDTKPQLEIYADDVACSHGCTIGQLDDDALFYLRSRGIAQKEAKAMLMYAFANDVLDNIKIPELQDKLNRIIAQKLGVDIDIER